MRVSLSSCQECRRRKIRCSYSSTGGLVCDGCKARNKPCLKVERRSRTDHISTTKSKALLVQKSHGLVTEFINIDVDKLQDIFLSVWPSEDVLERILNIPANAHSLFYGLSYRSSSVLKPDISEKLVNFIRSPSTDNPILIAKKLLILALYIQAIPNGSIDIPDDYSCYHKSLPNLLVKASCRVLVAYDNLGSTSLEVIECILIQAMFYNNAGDFRRAWFTNRQALSAAQLLGLHITRSNKETSGPESGNPIPLDPAYMWLRIVCNDCYLSLILSLPAGYNGNNFAALDISAILSPSDRMERLECVAGGMILEHLQHTNNSSPISSKINDTLIEAANCMPATWWSTAPNTALISETSIKAVHEISRLMLQITHYHLLIQLHLPEIIRNPSIGHQGADHSLLVTCNAARAMLTIYIAFKQHNKSSAHCRGIDVVALVSSAALAICYITTHHHSSTTNEQATIHPLSHQRQHDRGLLESTLSIMLKMARCKHDQIAERITSFLRPLLAIEEASWNGESYAVTRQETSQNSSLKVELPHIGIVHITKQDGEQDDFEKMFGSEGTLDWPLSDTELFDAFVKDTDFEFVS